MVGLKIFKESFLPLSTIIVSDCEVLETFVSILLIWDLWEKKHEKDSIDKNKKILIVIIYKDKNKKNRLQ